MIVDKSANGGARDGVFSLMKKALEFLRVSNT
jgi:hypothetical protein